MAPPVCLSVSVLGQNSELQSDPDDCAVCKLMHIELLWGAALVGHQLLLCFLFIFNAA